MNEYLISTIMFLEATYPSCAFILAGDFNRTFLPMIQSAVKSFNLKPTVTFPTRGDRILYQIFTNLGDYFFYQIRLPPFGLSDHATVYMGSSARSASKPKHKIIKSRDKRPGKVNSVGRYLLEIPWSSLLSSDQSCEGELSLLNEVINYDLNTIIPVRSIKIHETDRPWVSKHLKQLIIPRRKAFSFSRSLETKLTASASAAVWSITRKRFRYRYGPETSNVIGHRSFTIWIYTCFMHCVRPNLCVPSMAKRYGRH